MIICLFHYHLWQFILYCAQTSWTHFIYPDDFDLWFISITIWHNGLFSKKKKFHQFDTISKSIHNAWCFKSDTVVCVWNGCVDVHQGNPDQDVLMGQRSGGAGGQQGGPGGGQTGPRWGRPEAGHRTRSAAARMQTRTLCFGFFNHTFDKNWREMKADPAQLPRQMQCFLCALHSPCLYIRVRALMKVFQSKYWLDDAFSQILSRRSVQSVGISLASSSLRVGVCSNISGTILAAILILDCVHF